MTLFHAKKRHHGLSPGVATTIGVAAALGATVIAMGGIHDLRRYIRLVMI